MTKPTTRDRMVSSAITLLRERGAAGVTVDAVLAHSGAPRGSVYHHFPGGRAELLLTAGRTAADFITDLIEAGSESSSPEQAVGRFVAFWKESLERTDFQAGCPVVALAVDDRPDLPEAADLAREAFERWQTHLTRVLTTHGADPDSASSLATMTIAAIEGAVILCRTQRSSEPLDQVADRLVPMLRAALSPGSAATG